MERERDDDDDDDYRMMMTILDVTAPKVHLPHFLTCNAKIWLSIAPRPNGTFPPRELLQALSYSRNIALLGGRRYLRKEKVYKSLVPVDLCYLLSIQVRDSIG